MECKRVKFTQQEKIGLSLVKKQRADVICLQEMHIRKKDGKYLENKRLGCDFFPSDLKKVRGVVCYVNKDLNLLKFLMTIPGCEIYL